MVEKSRRSLICEIKRNPPSDTTTLARTIGQRTKDGMPTTQHNKQAKCRPELTNLQSTRQRMNIHYVDCEAQKGHCPLNQYLKRFNIIDDGQFECGQAKETVQYYQEW